MERTPLLIIDASVAVKWYVQEEDRDKALKLREDYAKGKIDLLAPELILYEVGNALRYHPNTDENLCSDGVKALRKMHLTMGTLEDDIIQKAAQIAYLEKITFYDAVYIAVAEKEDSKVISADEQLVRRLRKHRGRIAPLKSIPS